MMPDLRHVTEKLSFEFQGHMAQVVGINQILEKQIILDVVRGDPGIIRELILKRLKREFSTLVSLVAVIMLEIDRLSARHNCRQGVLIPADIERPIRPQPLGHKEPNISIGVRLPEVRKVARI